MTIIIDRAGSQRSPCTRCQEDVQPYYFINFGIRIFLQILLYLLLAPSSLTPLEPQSRFGDKLLEI